MDFRKYLKLAAGQLDREVAEILKEQLQRAKKTDKKLTSLIQAFINSCQGGKRIRGVLVVLGYEIATNVILSETKDINSKLYSSLIAQNDKREAQNDKKKSRNDIYKVAAAYEIFHSAVLVHDDIIDQSPTRREQPSLYQALGGNHYGISQAISLGDFGFFLGFKIISESKFPGEDKTKALEVFSKVMMDTAWGEMLDLEDTDPQLVMKLKTAYYTISGPLQVGAILAGAEERLIRGFGEFGENLGIAFQIRDDILDSEVENYKQSLQQLRYCKNKALKILPEITKDPKMSKILEQMCEYMVERNT